MPFTHNLPAPNTMANPAFSLRDNEHFPSLRGITVDNIFDGNTLDYYSEQGQTGILRPAKHWCLLTEIVEERQWIRPMYTVEDKAGDQFLVAFHHDYDGTPGFRVSETFGMPASRRLPESLAKNAKPGSVMAFMYAQNHMFADGQQGIRVEDLDQVKTFPCSLKTLLRIGDEVNLTLENCQMCNKSAYLRCASCSVVKYCGKECQVRNWKENHRGECKLYKKVREWKDRDWKKYTSAWETW